MPRRLEGLRRSRLLRPARRAWRSLRQAPRRKVEEELAYWRLRLQAEPEFPDDHYEAFYTTEFGLDREFYAGKRVLDIGCGPIGTLNWADMAAERIGLDPLVEAYRREFQIDRNAMDYVQATAEAMPFEDEHFDVITTFNSLDHVDDIRAAADEILRVLRPGGTLLIITELNHDIRWSEPQDFSFEVLDLFSPPLAIVDERRLASRTEGVYASVVDDVPWEQVAVAERPAVLVARLERPRPPDPAISAGGSP